MPVTARQSICEKNVTPCRRPMADYFHLPATYRRKHTLTLPL